MFILKAIYKNDKGVEITDSWHEFTKFNKITDKITQLQPDDFVCFEANDITDEVRIIIEQEKYLSEREKRKDLYEKLKKEFENG